VASSLIILAAFDRTADPLLVDSLPCTSCLLLGSSPPPPFTPFFFFFRKTLVYGPRFEVDRFWTFPLLLEVSFGVIDLLDFGYETIFMMASLFSFFDEDLCDFPLQAWMDRFSATPASSFFFSKGRCLFSSPFFFFPRNEDAVLPELFSFLCFFSMT